MSLQEPNRIPSLRARVLLWVSVTLVVLFGATIVALDATFRTSTERSLEELLEAHLLGLIALAEPHPLRGLTLPRDAVDPRFNVVDSGLYGALWDSEGERLWESLTWLEREPEFGALPQPGERRALQLEAPGYSPARGTLLGITWEFSNGELSPFVFGIAVSLEPYLERQASFRRNLIGWFAGMTLLMLVVIGALLSWVLRPLGALEGQVRAVEAGERGELSGTYPSELGGLARDLNALIDTERRRQVRYRNTLDDLAHSLKTPLAAMKSLLTGNTPKADRDEELVRELERMDQRVSHQLRRARVSGASGLGTKPIPVTHVVEDLRDSLDKVYQDKGVRCEVHVPAEVVFYGDRGDLTEILGNLLDNAYKYSAGRVRVVAKMQAARLVVTVADDGAGIDPRQLDELTRRGARADESVPGQGIGLAVVRETVEAYHGGLRLGVSELGGAEVRVELGRAGSWG